MPGGGGDRKALLRRGERHNYLLWSGGVRISWEPDRGWLGLGACQAPPGWRPTSGGTTRTWRPRPPWASSNPVPATSTPGGTIFSPDTKDRAGLSPPQRTDGVTESRWIRDYQPSLARSMALAGPGARRSMGRALVSARPRHQSSGAGISAEDAHHYHASWMPAFQVTGSSSGPSGGERAPLRRGCACDGNGNSLVSCPSAIWPPGPSRGRCRGRRTSVHLRRTSPPHLNPFLANPTHHGGNRLRAGGLVLGGARGSRRKRRGFGADQDGGRWSTDPDLPGCPGVRDGAELLGTAGPLRLVVVRDAVTGEILTWPRGGSLPLLAVPRRSAGSHRLDGLRSSNGGINRKYGTPGGGGRPPSRCRPSRNSHSGDREIRKRGAHYSFRRRNQVPVKATRRDQQPPLQDPKVRVSPCADRPPR